MDTHKTTQLREGKAKILFQTNHPSDHLIQHFKDDATAFNAQKKGQILNKGILNNQVSTWAFRYLEKHGIPTHFVDKLSDREMLIKRVDIIPVETVVRNKATGSICKRLGLEKGMPFNPPIVEYFYKSDELGDPLIGETHIFYFKWATPTELNTLTGYALRVNEILRGVFDACGLELIDFKLEFGRTKEGQVVLADEFTPDGCRLWDKKTGESMDKDRFRHDLGRVEESYIDVCERLRKFFEGKL